MNRTFIAAFIASCSLLCAACGSNGTGQGRTGNDQAALQVPAAQVRPFVIEPLRQDTSLPLRSLPQLPPQAAVPTEIPRPLNMPPPIALPPIAPPVPDPVLQESTTDAPAVEKLSTMNGISSTGYHPPDTNASVGSDQIVETVNMAYQIFDKASGRSLLGPSSIATLFTGFGGRCEFNPRSDPIVLFDKAAGRWLITYFAQDTTGYAECIAVSTTSDARGTYKRYAYDFGSMPDYPKFGVWPDAYYASFNNSTVACAYDRSAMLAGKPQAAAVCFPKPTGFNGILLPSDLDGSTPPPAGTPNFYVGASGATGETVNSLSMYRFHVDFAHPSKSTFTGPFPITVAPFLSQGYLVPQLGTTQLLDGGQVTLSGRLAYRNFGDHESLVVCHSLLPGVRWYEFRSPNAAPTVYQSGSFSPDSNIRFSCSAAMNGAGDIALGYSVTSSSMYPAIRFTGRLAADPLGQMRAETSIIEGGGSQTYTTRWGDYSSMSVDPVDDTMFVHANEFYATSGSAWSTRIATFKLNPFSTTGSMTASRFGHGAVLLPTGKVLVLGGRDASNAYLPSAELYDPATGTFTATGSMTTSRSTYTASLLPNGKVLVAGGYGSTGVVLATAEVYDPATGAFTATGSMSTPRVAYSATVLPNGKVLIAGGSSDGVNTLGTAELYDPATGSFAPTGSMSTARVTYVATLLPNGKVLIAGGQNASLGYLASAELYDPATGTFGATGSMTSVRHAYMETLLPNGKVLIAGGTTNGNNLGALASAELYDPATGTFAVTGSMTTARFYGSSSPRALANGKVLVIGGRDSVATILASAEVYDPATGTFTKAGNGASTAHFRAPVVPLGNGKVLIAGGATAVANAIATAELYDSGYPDGLGAFTATGSMGTARHAATAEPLPNGKVLVAGGSNSTGYLATAELYDPAAGTFTPTGSMIAARVLHTSTLLPNGKVLIVGGANPAGSLFSAELYDPATGTFTTTGSMPSAHYNHSATLLPSGKVLVVGGTGSSGTSAAAALYDPASGYFTATGSLVTARYGHRATLLPSGKVVVVGGTGVSGTLASAELYDPATGTFTTTGNMSNGRYLPTATLLPGGKVLVAGGAIGTTYFATADLYDPATGTFAPTGSMASTRYFHTATLLPNGKVLVAGGGNASWVAGAELYDPATGTFAATGSLLAARDGQVAALLPTNGRVLIAGGNFQGNYLTSAELYQ